MQFKAKTVEEATENGLKELGLTKDQALITVLEQPTKGLFGRLKGNAVVEITKIDSVEVKKVEKKEEKLEKKIVKESACNTVAFVQKILDIMEINAKAEQVEGEENATTINIIAEKGTEIIGFRGEIIDAIQTLAGAERNIGKEEYEKVVVDCENYREKRKDTLIKLAHKLEEKATEMKRDVILEPMSPFERRIIHTALAESEKVKTTSEGQEPNRYVVIVPNEKDEFSKPYNAGRNNDRHNSKKGFAKKGGIKSGDKNFKHSSGNGGKKKSSVSFGTYLGNSLKD